MYITRLQNYAKPIYKKKIMDNNYKTYTKHMKTYVQHI